MLLLNMSAQDVGSSNTNNNGSDDCVAIARALSGDRTRRRGSSYVDHNLDEQVPIATGPFLVL